MAAEIVLAAKLARLDYLLVGKVGEVALVYKRVDIPRGILCDVDQKRRSQFRLSPIGIFKFVNFGK